MRHAWCCLILLACGGAPPPPPQTVPAVDPAAQVKRVHAILTLSTACWLQRDDAKCKDLIVLADGKENPDEMAPLKALDMNVVREMQEKIEAFAHEDHLPIDRAKSASKLYAAIVDAQREALAARKAAETIKADENSEKVAAGDSKVAVDLKPAFALEALYKLEVEGYTKDAQLVALLTALDRVNAAKPLPKHLRMFAVSGVYKVVFGVEPSIKLEEPRPIRDGTWIQYVVQTAAAAGHPVAPGATDPKEQVRAAWEGIQAGFSDRIKAATTEGSPFQELSRK